MQLKSTTNFEESPNVFHMQYLDRGNRPILVRRWSPDSPQFAGVSDVVSFDSPLEYSSDTVDGYFNGLSVDCPLISPSKVSIRYVGCNTRLICIISEKVHRTFRIFLQTQTPSVYEKVDVELLEDSSPDSTSV